MATKILICDDDITEIAKLRQHIDTYASRNGLRFAVTSCTEKDIFDMMENGQKYDILFLDIYMKDLNGITLAQQQRRKGSVSEIAFFSSSKDHALEAFGVNASQYLVKPVSYEALEQALSLMLKRRIEEEAELNITFNSRLIRIRMADIVYCETIRHYQYITLSNGTVEKTRMSGAKLFEQLCDRQEFVRMGASYVINLKYVINMTANRLEMAGGHRLNIPRGTYAGLKEKYFTFYAEV